MNNELLIYQSEDGSIKIDVNVTEETVWLTQSQMVELFGKGRTTITEHIKNIFDELQERIREIRLSERVFYVFF